MNQDELAQFARRSLCILSPISDRSGKILYSAARTLRPGALYILGLNPGGDASRPEPSHYTIAEALRQLPDKTDSDFVDEVWQNRKLPGGSPLQKRMQWICSELGLSIEQVCAANLIFVRSPGAGGAGYPQNADVCWPVHELILGIVRPRLILTHGAQVYEYIVTKLSNSQPVSETFPSGHGKWACRHALVSFQGQSMHLVQLPHLSRYDPRRNPDLVPWLRRQLQERSDQK